MREMNSRSECVRLKITRQYAKWTVLSALRSGAPIKSRVDVNAVLDHLECDLPSLFDLSRGPIDEKEFEVWHKKTIRKMMDCKSALTFGWAAKMVAIYLKTTCYMAGYGREGLVDVIHPPIDNRLIRNLKIKYKHQEKIMKGLRSFKTITGMDVTIYGNIIGSCGLVGKKLECTPFEVEQLW